MIFLQLLISHSYGVTWTILLVKSLYKIYHTFTLFNLFRIVCNDYLISSELWLVEAKIWHSIRGAQMIVLMKIISYAHDKYLSRPSSHSENIDDKKKSYDSSKHSHKEDSNDSVSDVHSRRRRNSQSSDKVGMDKSSALAKCSTFSMSDGLEFCGYLVHPGSLVFGPWCSLETYKQILQPMSWVSFYDRIPFYRICWCDTIMLGFLV